MVSRQVRRMWVRLLGPVEAERGGAAVPVPGLRLKAILAALALRPGAVVSVDELVAVVWGDGAPDTAATTLQSHVSRLRRMFGVRDAIIARPPGYQLNLGPEPADAQVAERLIGEAARAGDPEGLRRVMALWRGRPLADLAHLSWFAEHGRRLDDLLLRARVALVEARLAHGEHAALLPELEEMSLRYPFHEQTHAQLMLALHRAGRREDALAVYRRLADTLGDELGIDPTPPLRELERCLEALDVLRAAGDDYGVANTLDTVGHARLHLGQAHEAIDCYRRSHELFHTLGDGFPAADVLFHLGEAYEAIGAADEARQAWERALDILTELGHSLAGRVRERLLG